MLAEIAPDRFEMGMGVNPNIYYERGYNLIDGHHRVAKAYIVRMEQHINFLAEGYEQYVEYWNDKLK
jgi:ParB-like chromosome segregation protein Spo0J